MNVSNDVQRVAGTIVFEFALLDRQRVVLDGLSGASLFEIFQTSRESEKVLAFDPSAG
jgi:hypothetical protein